MPLAVLSHLYFDIFQNKPNQTHPICSLPLLNPRHVKKERNESRHSSLQAGHRVEIFFELSFKFSQNIYLFLDHTVAGLRAKKGRKQLYWVLIDFSQTRVYTTFFPNEHLTPLKLPFLPHHPLLSILFRPTIVTPNPHLPFASHINSNHPLATPPLLPPLPAGPVACLPPF